MTQNGEKMMGIYSQKEIYNPKVKQKFKMPSNQEHHGTLLKQPKPQMGSQVGHASPTSLKKSR